MYATIAVGTDGSETASIAERVALELARTSAGRVLFLSVYEDEPGMQRSAGIVKAARARAEAAGVAVGTKTMRAEAAEGIVELADRGMPASSSSATSGWAAAERSAREVCPIGSPATCRATC